MEKEPKRANTHSTRDFRVACAINTARSDHDVWDSEVLAILRDDLLLLNLGIAIGVTTKFGTETPSTATLQLRACAKSMKERTSCSR